MQEKKRVRATPEERRESILQKALKLSEEKGFNNFTSLELADKCECAHSLIFHHFSSMDYLRKVIMQKAIEVPNLVVLGQGIVGKNKIACKAPEPLKHKALRALKIQ